MSFLCPSVGLLKFRRFTKTGLDNLRTRGLRSNVRNRGTSVSFERADSDVSIASQGGFSALYGEVNPVSQNEVSAPEDSAANDGEYFAGIYIGDAGKPRESARVSSSCQKTSKREYLAQDPVTVQSFTFFEETFTSSHHNEVVNDEEDEDEVVYMTQNNGAPKEQQTLLSNSANKISSSPPSTSKRAHYHLPNWVRQRRCLPTLNEVDFDKIDAISIGSLSLSSDTNNDDNNNNIIITERGSDKNHLQSKSKGPKVTMAKQSSAKRAYRDDVVNDIQTQNHLCQHLRFHREQLTNGAGAISVYSPKKTKRSESTTTDDSVFEREPILQLSVPPESPLKFKISKTSSGVKKSPSIGSLWRRSKKQESLRREKQPVGNNSGNNWSNVKAKTYQKKTDMGTGLKDSENIRVGNLVRSKPLYMRATSERALDPSAMKLRLESSTARKWRQAGGDRSPFSEVTNISQPQSSVCLRMEIVQRPVIRDEKHQEKSTLLPMKTRDSYRGYVRLPAGKIRTAPQRSKSAYSRDGSRRRDSLRWKSTVKMNSPRPVHLTVKEENIDNIFRNSISSNDRQQLLHPDVNQEKFGIFPTDKYSANPMAEIQQTNQLSRAPVPFSISDHVDLVKERTVSSNKGSKIVCVCEDTERGLERLVHHSHYPFQANCSGQEIVPGQHEKKTFTGGKNVKKMDAVVESNTLNSKQAGEAGVSQVAKTVTGSAEVDSKELPPKCIVRKPKFADNSVKEARIVSTSKMEVDTPPEEGNMAPPLPPKMMKSASFTGPSQIDAARDKTVSSKSTTRSATNVRALQTPLTQQQRRKLRRGVPGNRNGRTHRVSEVEASREDIVEVVAAMKASLDCTKAKGKKTIHQGTSFTKKAIGDAEAVYDFEARNENDVTVKVGDVVTVMNKDDPDWLFVKKHSGGQEGFVPRIFLQLKNIEEASEVQTSNDSSTISDVEKVEQKISPSLDTILEKTGLHSHPHVPNSNLRNSNHLASTNQLISYVQSDSKASEGAGAVRKVLTTTDQSQPSRAEMDGLHHHLSSQSNVEKNRDERWACDTVRDRKIGTNIRGVASAVLIETYVVVNDYTPQDDDEVSVVEGEIIVVNSGLQHELDWMWVYVPRTELFGFVPAFNARPLGFHYSDV